MSTVAIDQLANQRLLRQTDVQTIPLWLPFAVSGAIAVLGFACLHWLNFERHLVSDGRPAPAIVTRITAHHTAHGGTLRDIRYEFPLLSGAATSGKSH